MKGGKSRNFATRSFIEGLKKGMPKILHPCPYVGIYKIDKFTIPKHYILLAAPGTFSKKIITVKNGDNLLAIVEEIDQVW